MATLDEIKKVLTGFPYQLKWTNFRGEKTSPNPPHEAQSASYYQTHWTGAVSLTKGVYRISGFSIEVLVNGTLSWAVPSARTKPDLLQHEQGHYDITGLVARDMAMNMLDLTFDEAVVSALADVGKTAATRKLYVNGRLKAAFDEQLARADALLAKLQTDPQTRLPGIYDQQTNHSNNRQAQALWDDRFARLKRSSESFAFALTLAGVH